MPYSKFIKNNEKKRRKKFEVMKGYRFGTVVHFNNEKGFGVGIDHDGNRYILHYTNMDRVKFKILTKGQEIHFKPGLYKESLSAEDIAVVVG